MKKYFWIYKIVIFCILAGFGLVSLIRPQNAFSDNENRPLEQYPEWKLQGVLDGSFQQDFDNAFSDQFAGRDSWMGFSTSVEKLLGFRDIGDVYLGKDNYYFAKTTQEDIDQKNYLQNLRYVEYLGEKNAGKTQILLAPSPAVVLQDKLPQKAPYYDAKAMYEEADTLLSSVKNIKTQSTIVEYSRQNQVYYKTDHHWSLLGAYAAYCAYCNQNDETKHTYGYFTPQKITQDFFGTMYSKTLDPAAKADTMYAATNIPLADVTCDGTLKKGIYDVGKLTQKDKYAYFFGGNYGKAEIAMKQGGDKKLLVIKDSFANSFVPFLMEDYSDITMLDLRYYNASVQKLVEQGDYDRILILYEMSNFAQDTNIYKIVH